MFELCMQGTLPSRLHELHRLQEIDVGLNRLSGLIPYLAHIRDLRVFVTTSNDFEGIMCTVRQSVS